MSAKSLPPTALKDVRVLVVDDEDILAWSIDTELRALGADVTRAGSIREALERFGGGAPDVAITDLRLPDGNGLELLKKWRFEYPDMPVILITAHGAIDSAITAIRLGAFDYLQKPFDMKDLIAAVRRASEVSRLRQRVSSLTGAEAPESRLDIIGDGPAMRTVKERLEKIAKSKADTALILGESGAGKELAARAIHEWSSRRSQPFVEINCASIPETLLESELFGYEKGAFTDARERKLGLFEMARNGSIFLDEIGELPMKLQAKLLRALEYRRFKRLGGTKDIEFQGRIIAATNRNLLVESQEQRFRADLYYRLNVLTVTLPPLRQHPEDLPTLTAFFVKQLAEELGLDVPGVSAEAMAKLAAHSWPGNVRELRNVLQRALVFHEPKVLAPQHLDLDQVTRVAPLAMPAAALPVEALPQLAVDHATPVAGATPVSGAVAIPAPVAVAIPAPSAAAAPADTGYRLPHDGVNLEDLEKSLLIQALERARNNQTRAAQLLGISRHTLRYRLEKYGLAQDSEATV
jgi:DNA-binding NtrC family response regulator